MAARGIVLWRWEFEMAGRPYGQGSHQAMRRPSGGIYYKVSDSERAHRARMIAAMRRLWRTDGPPKVGGRKWLGPVSVDARFVFDRPKSQLSARGGPKPSAPLWHVQTPDLDHLARLAGDALTQSHVLDDDRQIAEWTARRVWGNREGQAGTWLTVTGWATEKMGVGA